MYSVEIAFVIQETWPEGKRLTRRARRAIKKVSRKALIKELTFHGCKDSQGHPNPLACVSRRLWQKRIKEILRLIDNATSQEALIEELKKIGI